jgi:hypothetical protein
MYSAHQLAYLSIQDIDRFRPLFFRYPMFNNLAMITIQIRVEQIQIRTSMTQDELVHHLGIQIILLIS